MIWMCCLRIDIFSMIWSLTQRWPRFFQDKGAWGPPFSSSLHIQDNTELHFIFRAFIQIKTLLFFPLVSVVFWGLHTHGTAGRPVLFNYSCSNVFFFPIFFVIGPFFCLVKSLSLCILSPFVHPHSDICIGGVHFESYIQLVLQLSRP